MNCELKYRFNYRFTIALLVILTLFFGAVGIAYRIKGLIIVPLTSAFLATLICFEKSRVLSVAISVSLITAEFIIGSASYYTLNSASSIVIALIISVCYLRGIRKDDSALFCTLVMSLLITLTVVLYILGTIEGASLDNLFESFILIFDEIKSRIISYLTVATVQSDANFETTSQKYLGEIFDAYLNYIVALVVIISFIAVGISHKIFTKLMQGYTRNSDIINSRRFMPTPSFAYFYFIVAIFSMFTTETEDDISLSVINLYLIFMVVFAYVGYKFISAVMKKNGRKSLFVSFILLVLIATFSSVAIQLLAVIGAFVAINYAKFLKNFNSNDNPLSK